MKQILLEHWKFHYNDCPDAWYKGYEENNWEEVFVPHDWSVHMPFSKEYSSGTGYLAGGIGWYRTSFTLPEAMKGKKIYITFDGVYKNSQVWCNSYYLGKRPFGYTTFRYDITEQACFGDTPNVIAVRVDHTDIADSRWFTGSGIVRKVTITCEEPVHAEYQGIFFKTPSVTKEQAVIEISNRVVNDTASEVLVTVKNHLAFLGKDAYTVTESTQLSPYETREIKTKGILHQPALWSVDTPNLYQLLTTITAKELTSSVEYKEHSTLCVGIRSFHFDVDKGFFLNNTPMKIKGVCVHHDAGCLGAAVYPKVWYRRLLALKDMGCNAIRMSHNPHMPELYDLCDALGFLVMDEAFDEWEGPKNKWWTGHNVYPPKLQGYYEDFPQWHEKDLSDLIKRDRNHPGIIMWSIGNEIDYPNDPYCHPLFTSMTGNNDKDKPAAERQYNNNRPNAERLSVIAKKLTEIVKAIDDTRPVTAAVAFPELSTHIGYIDSFDVVGYNYKEQFYEQDHLRFPNKSFLGSENSHSFKAWKAVRDTNYISAQFLWTGIDYLGEAAGWPVRGSDAGILTLAGYPKTSYYRRKSWWADTPVLYLATNYAKREENGFKDRKEITDEFKSMYRSWSYVPGEFIEVRCYTNAALTELFLNGKSLGKKAYEDTLGYIQWFVPFEGGELTAIGYDSEEKEQSRDSIFTTGSSCCIQLQEWKPNPAYKGLNPDYIKEISDTADILEIEATVTDANGHRVVTDSSLLQVSVTGGKLLGLENGNLSDCTEYSLPARRTHEGRLLLYIIRNNAETVTVTVTARGLKTSVLTSPCN